MCGSKADSDAHSGSEGREFESLRAHQKNKATGTFRSFCFSIAQRRFREIGREVIGMVSLELLLRSTSTGIMFSGECCVEWLSEYKADHHGTLVDFGCVSGTTDLLGKMCWVFSSLSQSMTFRMPM